MSDLGRPYPRGIEDDIARLGKDLDELMASSTDLLMRADYDARDQIREINSRLVNEIIIVSDQISDEEVDQRLRNLRAEVFAIQGIFKEQGVPIIGYQAVPTTEDLAIIPYSQASSLAAEFRAAYDLYPSVVERYARIRPLVEQLGVVPLVGGMVGGFLSAMDGRMNALDEDVFFARDAIDGLQVMLQDRTDAVRIARQTFVRIQNWISGVYQMDELLKRMEGKAEGKPAETTGASWGTVALVGGIAAVGLFVVLSV